MKILIKDNWAKNLGDVAIAEAMIEQMRSVFPGCEITLESSHPEITRRYFPDVTIVTRLFDVSKLIHAKSVLSWTFMAKNLPFLLTVITTFVRSFLFVFLKQSRSSIPVLNAYRSADLVLSAGGDFLSEKYGYYLRFYEYFLVSHLGKPLILYAQSIGPFKVWKLPFVRWGLNKADAILARDQKTFDLMQSYGVRAQTYLTADSVIILKPQKTEKVSGYITHNNINDRTACFVVRDIKYTGISQRDHRLYCEGIVATIRAVKDRGYVPCFLAPNDEDGSLARALSTEFGLGMNVIDTKDFLPSEIKYLLSQAKFLVSARMHPMIIASTAGTPVVCTGLEFKMKNYLEALGMGDAYFDMIPLDSDALIARIDALLADYDLTKDSLAVAVDSLSERSLRNAERTREVYHQHPKS